MVEAPWTLYFFPELAPCELHNYTFYSELAATLPQRSEGGRRGSKLRHGDLIKDPTKHGWEILMKNGAL